MTYLSPILASILVFAVFAYFLQRRLGENIFGELGFLYIGLIMAYTVVPGFAFMSASLFQGGPLDQLLPDPAQLRAHLWRQVLFQTGVASGYLLLRGRTIWQAPAIVEGHDRDRRTLMLVAFLIVVSVSTLTLRDT